MFQKYEKIPLSRLPEKASAGGQFVVTEKVHGANFSVHASAVGVECAKRSGILAVDDNFYSFRSQHLALQLETCGAALFGSLSTPAGRARLLGEQWSAVQLAKASVYGELFGGAYPHPEVAAVPGLQAVQKGIWYSHELCFLGFDLLLYPAETGASPIYADFGAARAACEGAGFMFAAPLYTGTLAGCLEFGERFDSTIPARLGLPAIPGPNLAEGVVIKAVKTGGGQRAIFKVKIPEFSEAAEYQNNDWKASKGGSSGYDAAQQLLLCEMLALVTENRLNNVLSKHGRIHKGDKAGCKLVLHALKVDVIEDLAVTVEQPGLTLQKLPAAVNSELERQARQLIVAHLANVTD